jgi:hypothetical protein
MAAMEAAAAPPTARRDVALSFLLATNGDPLADQLRFRRIWQSVALDNPTLVEQTRAVFLLSLGEPASSGAEAELWGGSPVFRVSGASWGRCLNDLFLCVSMCEEMRHWVHWDDRHVCSRPFWSSARSVLEGPGFGLCQLQLCDDWSRDHPASLRLPRDGFTQLLPNPIVAASRHDADDARWPVFWLGPSVHPLAFYRAAMRAGYFFKLFDEETDWNGVEWHFGRRLEELGAVVGVLDPVVAAELKDEEDDDDDDALSWAS